MTFKQSPAPYQRGKKSTLQIMIELTIALAIVWIAAVVTTFLKAGTKYGINSIFLMVVSVAVTFVCDVVVTILKSGFKFNKDLLVNIRHDIIHSYSWVTAMIFTLCCPVWTRYYVIVVGSIFSTLIGKHVFGGFGKNIFNPAAIGRIFIAICFGAELGAPNGFGVAADGSTGATVTTVINSSMNWLGDNPVAGYKVIDLLTGNYFGAMGETFTILLVVLGIILAIRKDINWRAPVFYVGTVAVSALLIGLVLGFKNPGLYLLYHLATGGLLFGAVFMITDPVTTPTSPFGNCLIGVVAGLLVVLTRIATNAAEGVVYSLVVVNLISPMIDALVKGKTSKRLPVKYGVTFGAAALSVALSIGVAWAQNGGRELYAINGLSIEEYNNVKASCNVDWISANDYDFKVYSKEQPATVQAAYSIIDKDGNEVGVVYLADSKLSGGKFVIETEEYTLSADGSIYVVFELATKNIVGVSLIKGSTAEMYNKKAQDWYNENLNISGGLVNYVPAMDGTIGASYSVLGFQKLIKVAYDAFVSDYGA